VVVWIIVTNGMMFVVVWIIVTNGTMFVGKFVCTMIIGFAGNGDTLASSPHENDTIDSAEDDVAVNVGDPIAAGPSPGSLDGLHVQEAYFNTES